MRACPFAIRFSFHVFIAEFFFRIFDLYAAWLCAVCNMCMFDIQLNFVSTSIMFIIVMCRLVSIDHLRVSAAKMCSSPIVLGDGGARSSTTKIGLVCILNAAQKRGGSNFVCIPLFPSTHTHTHTSANRHGNGLLHRVEQLQKCAQTAGRRLRRKVKNGLLDFVGK